MKKPALLLLALAALPASALDLTPGFILTDADGVSIRRPYFSDGGKKYAITLNSETELTPYEDGCLFRFTKLRDSAMRLRPSTFSTAVKFGPDTLERYEQAARKLLPQSATNVALDSQVPDPLPINGWTSHRFIYRYTMPAGDTRESITFLNILPGTQIVMHVYAPAKDFPDAAARAHNLIRRWHELDSATIISRN